MSQPLASRAAMQSALDQWSAVDRLSDLAKRVLTPEEVELVEAPLRKSAGECLHMLETDEVPHISGEHHSDDDDITEVVNLRKKLKKIATGA